MSDKKFCPYCKSAVNSGTCCPDCKTLYHKSCATRMVDAGVFKCCGHTLHNPGPSRSSENDSPVVDAQPSTSTSTSSSGSSRTKVSSRNSTEAQAPGDRMSSARQNSSAGRSGRTTTTTAAMPPPPPYDEAAAHSLSSTGNTTNTTSSLSVRAQSADSIAYDTSSATTSAVTGISLQRLSGIISAQLERNNQSIIDRIDQLASQISVIALEDRVVTVEKAQPNVNINVDSLTFELQERIYRANNVIIYRVPKNRNISDYDAVVQLLVPIPGLDLTRVTVNRSRRSMGDEPRFIVVRLSSPQDALRVLRNRRLLPTGIDVTADRTLAQREQFRAVKREVEEHNIANPNNQKRIKYINGEPKAVFIRDPRQRNN